VPASSQQIRRTNESKKSKRKETEMPKQKMIKDVATPLMETAQEFVEIKTELQEKKIKLKETKDKVLIEMKKEGREMLTVTVGVDNFIFTVDHKSDDLKCVKQTKSPVVDNDDLL
jgi:hypothetical protein